jgi:ribokinase
MSDRGKYMVVGVGQCAYDIVGALDVYPQVDQKIELSEVTLQGGGPVATALVTLSRLGIETAICSRIGGDLFGERIRAGLISEKVDCSALSTDTNGTSQLAFIAVDAFGKRTIFWHRGTAKPLAAQEIDAELISGADILHLDGLHFAEAYSAAEIARKYNVVTVLDGGSLRERTLELLPLIDHLVVSENFARQFCGDVELEFEKVLDRLLDYGGVAATVTCGEKGSWTKSNGEGLLHQPAFTVNVVDTTGCGDVFHGGYIYGLLQGMSIRETVRFAAASAALKAQSIGGRIGIPALSDINIFMGENMFK